MHNYVRNILKMKIFLLDIELSGLTGKIWTDAMFVTWMRYQTDYLSAYLLNTPVLFSTLRSQ